ncbi:MAG: diadenosine tetraphosphate hydrolase [Phycisphaerales bacterium]|nr:diadenosine tetraphosphate hydrolase [Phycisphaerales bacterium]
MTEPCGVCTIQQSNASRQDFAWENERWLLRHHPHPAPLNGWFLLDAKRHVASVADLDVTESKEFGHVLRASMRSIRSVLSIPRVYVVMFGEGAPHLHAHLIPRDPSQEGTAAWEIADWYRAVASGVRESAAPTQVKETVARVGAMMRAEITL